MCPWGIPFTLRVQAFFYFCPESKSAMASDHIIVPRTKIYEAFSSALLYFPNTPQRFMLLAGGRVWILLGSG
jgi:hypothetical protein